MSSCVRVNRIDSFILPSPAQGPSGIPTPAPRPGLEQCQVNSHPALEVASGSSLHVIDSAGLSGLVFDILLNSVFRFTSNDSCIVYWADYTVG